MRTECKKCGTETEHKQTNYGLVCISCSTVVKSGKLEHFNKMSCVKGAPCK